VDFTYNPTLNVQRLLLRVITNEKLKLIILRLGSIYEKTNKFVTGSVHAELGIFFKFINQIIILELKMSSRSTLIRKT
jgi:hypothetical protein